MKKLLLWTIVIVGIFGYLTHVWMRQEGWSIFSKEDVNVAATTTVVIATSTSTIPLLFVGDIMMGRFVETLGKQYEDTAFSFASTSAFLKSHITIANLEGPIPLKHVPTPINGMSFSFPTTTPKLLKENGITAVSLANNHMFDKGKTGQDETRRALDVAGVKHFGGYTPTESNYFETSLGDKRVIVYGIGVIATGWDEEQALIVTEKLRYAHPDVHLVAFLHWGNEYATQNAYQRELAHKLIDKGADAIIGAHPHVVQGIEIYKDKPIFYSLGNFIFDQYFAKNVEQGLAVELSLDASSYIYTLVPIISKRSVPSIATGESREEILKDLARQSDSVLNSSILNGALTLPK